MWFSVKSNIIRIIRMWSKRASEFAASYSLFSNPPRWDIATWWTKSCKFCTASQHVLDSCLFSSLLLLPPITQLLQLLTEQRNYSHLPTSSNQKPLSKQWPAAPPTYKRASYHFLRLSSRAGSGGGLGDGFGMVDLTLDYSSCLLVILSSTG